MSSSKKTTSNSTQANKINPQQAADFTQNYQSGQNTADLPFTPFTGEMTAPLSSNENLAIANAPSMFGAGMGSIKAAQDTAQGLTGYQAPQVPRGSVRDLTSGDVTGAISKYMDPFTNDVVNASLSDIERARQMQRVNDQQHTPMGAFGGSRQGVADSQTNEAFQRTGANMAANLRSAGFNNAAGLAETDAQRALAAEGQNQNADLSVGQFNANADMNAAGVRGQGASLLGDLGGQERAGQLDALNANMATGGLDRSVQQNRDAAAMQEFSRNVNYPLLQQQLKDSSLQSLIPILEQTNTTNTNSKETTNPGAMGMLSALGGLAMGVGSMGMGFPAMGGMSGLFGGGFPAAMSVTPQIFGSNAGGYMGR